jgi:rhodanese-related sulfurtransferase
VRLLIETISHEKSKNPYAEVNGMEPTRITVQEAKARIDRGERIVFIDTRSAEAWSKSDVKIPGAIRVPADEVAPRLEDIPLEATLVTYCT